MSFGNVFEPSAEVQRRYSTRGSGCCLTTDPSLPDLTTDPQPGLSGDVLHASLLDDEEPSPATAASSTTCATETTSFTEPLLPDPAPELA